MVHNRVIGHEYDACEICGKVVHVKEMVGPYCRDCEDERQDVIENCEHTFFGSRAGR